MTAMGGHWTSACMLLDSLAATSAYSHSDKLPTSGRGPEDEENKGS
jgi:hypothetical protein